MQAGTVTLANMAVRNGLVVGAGFSPDAKGGGIRSFGSLSLIGCVVTDNRSVGADEPSAAFPGTAYGGGIYQTGGGLNLTDSTIRNNKALGGNLIEPTGIFDAFAGGAVGGGVDVSGGVLTVYRCIVAGNQAVGGEAVRTVSSVNVGGGEAIGGGIVASNATGHQIVDSTIAGNRAVGGNGTGPAGGGGNGSGGGLWLGNSATVSGCTILSNQAVGGTGTTTGTTTRGNGGDGLGGGIVALAGLITNSTITANTAMGGTSNRAAGDAKGGGFSAAVQRTSDAAFRSTIVAGNTATTSSADIVRTRTNVPASLGNNLIGSGTGAPDFMDGLTGDQVGTPVALVDPLLGPLADNGGPTPTHLPAAASPAINHGSNPAGLAVDQRGLPRVSGSAPDVGAVELTYPLPWATLQRPTVPLGGALLRFTVTYSDDRGIAVGSLGTGDLRVTGPNGFSVIPAFASVDVPSDGTPRTAVYSFTAPGGNWDAAVNGTYNVSIQPGEVMDVDGNGAPAGVVGTIQVGLPFVVTNANESGPGSLRQALLDANALTGPDTIAFDPLFFSTPRTITLASGALSVTESVTVTGPGAAFVTLNGNNGNNRDRIMVLRAPVVSLSGLPSRAASLLAGTRPAAEQSSAWTPT